VVFRLPWLVDWHGGDEPSPLHEGSLKRVLRSASVGKSV